MSLYIVGYLTSKYLLEPILVPDRRQMRIGQVHGGRVLRRKAAAYLSFSWPSSQSCLYFKVGGSVYAQDTAEHPSAYPAQVDHNRLRLISYVCSPMCKYLNNAV